MREFNLFSRFIKKIESTDNSWLLVIVILISIISLIPPWIHYDIIANDGAFWYIPIAKMYLNGSFIKALKLELPVYPILLAGVSYLTNFNIELAGRIISAVFYVLSAIGIFKLTQTVFKSTTVSILAVIFLITNRDLMELGVDCLKETLIVCLILWATFFMMYWLQINKKVRYFFISMLFYLLAALVRSTAMFFLIAWGFIWIISIKNWKTRVILIFLLGSLTIYAFNYKVVLQMSSLRSYDLVNLKLDENIIIQILKYLECYFTASNPGAVVLAVFGVILIFKQDTYKKFVLLVLLISLIILGMKEYVSDRFMMPIIMILYPVSAYVVIRCISSGKKVFQFIGIVVVIYSAIQWVDLSLTQPQPRKLAIRQSGQWIYENYGNELTISTNQNRVVFYARKNYTIDDTPNFGTIDLSKHSDIVAVDVSKDNGVDIKKAVEAKGGRLVKEITPIFIYTLEPLTK